MTALASGTQIKRMTPPSVRTGPQKAATVVYQGATIMVDTAGKIRPAAAGVPGAFCAGVALPRSRDLDRYDNTSGSDGDLDIEYEEGIFGRVNDGTNPILSTTQPGTILFAVDDQTVSLSSSSATRPVAGRFVRLVGSIVFLEMGLEIGRKADEEAGQSIADPGNAGAIPVTRSGVCSMVSAGAETRTLAIPSFKGQRLTLIADTVGGTITVTSAQGVNQAANTTLAFAQAADMVHLVAATVAGALRWRVIGNDGVALS